MAGGPPPPPGSGAPPPPGASGGSGTTKAPATGFTAQEFNNKIKHIPAGQLFTSAPPSYSQEDWFLYFWKEAKGNMQDNASFEQSKLVREFFSTVFDKGPDFDKSNPDFVNDRMLVAKVPFSDHCTDAKMRKYLEALLRIGFDSIDLSSDDTASDMARFKLMQDTVLKASIYWRAEDRRGFETLRQQGYQKQAIDVTPGSKSRRAEINCDKAWHPFSDPAITRKIWYRRASSDNCWYTAVSIASAWQTSVCYPKIGQTSKLQILKGTPPPVVNEAFRLAHPELIGLVEFANGDKKLMMVTESKVAMVVIDDVIFNTQAKQAADKGKDNAYDEKAVSRIDGRNVMAIVHFWRVHHGADDEDGFTAIVDRTQVKKQIGVLDLVKMLGDYESASSMRAQIEAAYDDALNSDQISLRWATTGWAEVPSIGKVRGITLNGRRIY